MHNMFWNARIYKCILLSLNFYHLSYFFYKAYIYYCNRNLVRHLCSKKVYFILFYFICQVCTQTKNDMLEKWKCDIKAILTHSITNKMFLKNSQKNLNFNQNEVSSCFMTSPALGLKYAFPQNFANIIFPWKRITYSYALGRTLDIVWCYLILLKGNF